MLTMKELCYALGISETMGYRLKERGMPTHSIEEAEKWRARHLEPTRTKKYREDGNKGVRSEVGAQPAARNETWLTSAEIRLLEKDPVSKLLRSLPGYLCNPLVIAAVAKDAGLTLSGCQLLRFAQHLCNAQMILLSWGEHVKFEVPTMLSFHPESEGFDKAAGIIDRLLNDPKCSGLLSESLWS
jgi:hypothetical protein